jgi:hypothetical protein
VPRAEPAASRTHRAKRSSHAETQRRGERTAGLSAPLRLCVTLFRHASGRPPSGDALGDLNPRTHVDVGPSGERSDVPPFQPQQLHQVVRCRARKRSPRSPSAWQSFSPPRATARTPPAKGRGSCAGPGSLRDTAALRGPGWRSRPFGEALRPVRAPRSHARSRHSAEGRIHRHLAPVNAERPGFGDLLVFAPHSQFIVSLSALSGSAAVQNSPIRWWSMGSRLLLGAARKGSAKCRVSWAKTGDSVEFIGPVIERVEHLEVLPLSRIRQPTIRRHENDREVPLQTLAYLYRRGQVNCVCGCDVEQRLRGDQPGGVVEDLIIDPQDPDAPLPYSRWNSATSAGSRAIASRC